MLDDVARSKGRGHLFIQQDLAGFGQHHKPCCQIDRRALNAKGATDITAVGAHAHPSPRHADLDDGPESQVGRWVLQSVCDGRSPSRIVVMGDRRAEGRIEITAFVAGRDLDQRCLDLGQGLLNPTDVGIQLGRCIRIALWVQAIDPHKEGDSRAQLTQITDVAGRNPVSHCGQQPLLCLFSRQFEFNVGVGAEFGHGRHFGVGVGTHERKTGAIMARSPASDPNFLADRRQRLFIDQRFALVGQLLRGRRAIDNTADNHVDSLNRRIANQESPCLPARNRRLDGEMNVG